GAAGLALAPGVGSGAGAAKAVPGAASTVTAQTTATATVTNPRFPLPVRVPGAVPMTHSPNWLTVGNVRSPGGCCHVGPRSNRGSGPAVRPRGITADEGLPSAPVPLGQLGEGETGGGDVVGGGVRARVFGAEKSGDGFAGSARPVVDEPHQGVMAMGLLPGRGRVLLVGVGDDQDSVQVHDHLPTSVRCPAAGGSA